MPGGIMTTPSTEQFVEFLLADDCRSAVVAQAISETGSWKHALALARSWNVIPTLHARVQNLSCALNTTDTAALRREFLKVYQQSAVRAVKAIAAVRGLQQAGIPVTAFKGIASMAVLYGNPKHRTIHDADVLVLPKDLTRAVACLEELGFGRHGSETLTEYRHFVENSPGFAGNRAVALYGPDGSEIDLHWALAGSGLATEEILARSVSADLMDSTIPVVESKDGLLLTLHHAIRENLAIDSVCRDLLDVREWCGHFHECGELGAAIEWAVRAGSHVAALAITGLLASYDRVTAAAQAAALLGERASSAERRSAARLVEIFHHQLHYGRLSKDVFYLVHSRPWRQILKGLGKDWSGYRRSMQAIEQQLGQTRPLRQRATLLAKSVSSVRGLRLARELAILKYRIN
jgi:hypothetical protein